MTDPANILSGVDVVLDFAEGPWKPEPDRDGDGLRRQRYFIWLTNDAGDSLQIDEGSAVLLANTYPEALAVVRAAAANLTAEQEPAYSWVIESRSARREGRPNREVERMDRIARTRRDLAEALAAFLAAARDATEAGS